MKKAIFAIAFGLVASTASAAISGSSHDLTATYGGGAKCAYCHMPHNAVVAGTVAPLWARNLYVNATATYTMYSSMFGGQTSTGIGDGSRLCLSCHDGTQAVASTYGSGVLANFGGNTTKLTSASAAFQGQNLASDHPVGVTYTANATNGLAAVPPTFYKVLAGGKLECTGCHNAHTAAGVATGYPNRRFLVATGGTDFCSGCHSLK